MEEEKEKFDKKEDKDEVKTTLEEEIKAGEWQRLKEFPTYGKRSRQGKIIATYQALSNRLNQLISLYYEFVRNHPDKAVRMLKEIRRLRYLQEYLLNCLIWIEQGEFDEHEMPEELEEMI